MNAEKEADKEISPASSAIVPQSMNVEALIAQAIEKGTPVETMERILAMGREVRAELAKKAFDQSMAAFQADCPTIEKTKEVKTRSGVVAYRYAPIESIVEQVKPHLQKHGFSYSSNMELIENGTTKVKASIKVTHEGGHSEITDMTVPLGNKTDIMSQSQVVAAAQTFAKRYAFCNAFGILTGDEDTDARPAESKAGPSEQQIALVKSLCKERRVRVTDVIPSFSKEDFQDKAKVKELIDALLVFKPKSAIEQEAEGMDKQLKQIA
jgi:hypothetical protein